MRIAITGASGTGKTHLAGLIAAKYYLPLNPIGARSVAASMGFQNPYDVDRAGRRKEFQERLFSSKRDWELQHDSFVTDRSYFDNLTYCALHMPTEMPDDAIETYSLAMERYDVVLVTPKIVFQKLDDGIRQSSSAYHDFYELILMRLLQRKAIRYKRILLYQSLDERAAWVEEVHYDDWIRP